MDFRDLLALSSFIDNVKSALTAITDVLEDHVGRIGALEQAVSDPRGIVTNHTSRLNAMNALRQLDLDAHRDLVIEVKRQKQVIDALLARQAEMETQIAGLQDYGITERDLAQAFESHMASWKHEVEPNDL
jgi:hypothetical protein